MSALQKFVRWALLEAQRDAKPLLKINQRQSQRGKPTLFSDQTLDLISRIPETDLTQLSNRKGFIKWLANAVEGAQHPPRREQIRHVIDFINGNQVDPASLGSFDDALRVSEEWHAALAQSAQDGTREKALATEHVPPIDSSMQAGLSF